MGACTSNKQTVGEEAKWSAIKQASVWSTSDGWIDLERSKLHLYVLWGDYIELKLHYNIQTVEDINSKDLYGRTPIFYAVTDRCDEEIFDWLYEKGADLYIKDNVGRDLLYYAKLHENTRICTLIKELKRKHIQYQNSILYRMNSY